MTHKAKVGDTVRRTVSGASSLKEYVVTELYTYLDVKGVWIRTDGRERGGLLYEHHYEVVKKAEPEMFFLTSRDLRAGAVGQLTILSAEAVEKRLNEPNADDLTVYKLVPVEIKEVAVTVKKKVIC